MFTSLKFRLIALALVVFATAMLAAYVDRLERERTFVNFEGFVNDGQTALIDRVDDFVRTLDGASGLFQASAAVTAQDWRRYADALDIEGNFPGILGLGYITLVKAGPDFDATQETSHRGQVLPPIHPDTGLDERFVVQFVEPLALNRGALGLDMGFEPTRRAVAEKARATNTAQLTPPIELVQANQAKSGFLILVPNFDSQSDLASPEDRNAAFRGWVYMPFIGEALFAAVNLDDSMVAHLDVTDVTNPQMPISVFTSKSQVDGRTPLHTINRDIEIYGRTWNVVWQSTPAFEVANLAISQWIVLALGMVIGASLFVFLHQNALRSRKIELMVEQKTKELKAKSEEAQSVIDNAVVSVFVLDGGRNILSFNAASVGLFGIDRLQVGTSIETLITFSNDSVFQQGTTGYALAKDGTELILVIEENEWTTASGKMRQTLLVQDVTVAETGARKLQENEARWNNALAGAQIGVFDINLQTGISVVSDTWRELMSVPKDMSDSDAQKTFLSRIHPDDLPKLDAADKACIEGKTDRSIAEYRIRFDDGTYRWMKSDAIVSERAADGTALRLLGAQTDVHDLNVAEAALRASRERFELVLQEAPVGMALLDGNGKFNGMNQALCAMTGHQENELRDLVRFRDLLSRKDLISILQAIDDMRNQKRSSYQGEHQIYAKTGVPFWGLLSIAWTSDPETGEDVYIVQIYDITEKKAVEQMKSQFVATVSHELRTPLTSIKGALGLLGGPMKSQMPKGADRLLEIAASNADRLTSLVNDILDLEKISSGEIEFQIEPHCIADLVRSGVEQILPYAVQHKVRFETRLPDGPVCADVDHQRTEQLIANLLSNACKYSDDNTIVRVHLESVDGMALVCVLNSGPPISDEFRSRIFQPFSQADGSDTRAKGGTGLGLNISRQIAERMGGKIGFESEENALTAFWFTVPLSKDAAGQRTELSAKTGANTESQTQLNVLHLEDDDDFLEIVKKGLDNKASVVAARTLLEAREAVKNDAFDVIVIDWDLPDGHGRDLIEDIQRMQPKARVIALSAQESGVRDIRIDHEIVKSRTDLSDIVHKVIGTIKHAS